VSSPERGYVFDMAWERERERLAANEQFWDPFSVRILEGLAVAEGMRVLDVGAAASYQSRSSGRSDCHR
jgi:protein-L-isoaspartate O-methyltransferase